MDDANGYSGNSVVPTNALYPRIDRTESAFDLGVRKNFSCGRLRAFFISQSEARGGCKAAACDEENKL